MNLKYKGLVFDFFGVIASDVAPLWFQKHFTLEEALKLKQEYLEDADKGLVSEDQLMHNLSQLVKIPDSEVRRQWKELIFLDPEVIQLLKECKPYFKLALCSNAISSFIRPFLKREDLENVFDHIIISSEVGITKPSKEIFQITLDKMAIPSSQTVLIDDNEANIKGAESIGMQGIVFSTAAELRKKLIL